MHLLRFVERSLKKTCPYLSIYVFRKDDLIAFRGSDEYCLKIIELTNDIDLKRMTPRSKVKGNILTFHSEDEEDVVIFQREDKWKEVICNLLIF